MRAVVWLVVAAVFGAADLASAQSANDSAAFWKTVQTNCNAAAAKPSGEAGQRIAQIAIEEYNSFGGHRVDSDGRLIVFGQTEAEQSVSPTARLEGSVGHLAWWRVMKYWQALFGDGAPDKLEVLGFGDATAKTDEADVAPLIRTTAARLLRAAEAEPDAETREVLREAAWRLAVIDTPWSAAFISYVVRRAGASGETFQFSNAHRGYIYDAFATSAAEVAGRPDLRLYRACPPATTPPRPGDLICHQRERTLAAATDREVRDLIRAEVSNGGATRTVRSTHCEIVAHVDRPARKVYTISGNVNQSVTARKLNLRADMKLSARHGPCGGPGYWTLPAPKPQTAEAPVRDGGCTLNDRNWFVLLQLR